MKLAIVDIYANPDQPRQRFDEAGLQELAASIEGAGLLQPITVCRRPHGLGQYMIVAGERRFRAHQLLGRSMIEANVVDITDDELAVAAIVENLQRTDISPLEEALAFQRMLNQGYSVESLALRLGLKQPHRISDRLQLLRLRPDYLDLFRKGHLTPSQAFELSRLEPAAQTALFAMLQAGRCDTYAKLRAAADGILAAAAQASMFDLPPPPTEDEVATLSKFERMVSKLIAICNDGIQENEVVVLRKINPDRAATIGQQLGLIRDDLARMEKALQYSAAQGVLLAA